MIDLGLLEGIKKLKERFTGEDYDQSQIGIIEAWEKRILELSEREDFARLETTKAIASELKDRIKSYYIQRSQTRDQETLLMLDAKIDEDKWLAKLLCANPAEEIQELSELVANELSDA